ncbi:MAG: cell division protein FtsA, partial [Parcubacteria group bacterium]
RGAVIDIEENSQAISLAAEKLEGIIEQKIKNAVLGIGGTEIKMNESKGVIAIGRANGEVSGDDIERVLESAQNASMPVNNETVHVVPKEYKLDDQSGIKNPIGMHGIRLEVDALMIEDSATHLSNLTKSASQAGISVGGIMAGPLAAATAVLDKNEKELGVVVIDIGGGTTSISIFEEGDLAYISVLPIGAGHITNDIAIGLRVPIETAEKVKLGYGSAFPENISKREMIDLSIVDPQEQGEVSRYHVAEIIEARLSEIFEMVNGELKKIGKAGLLPSGAVLVGGGAELHDIVNFAKNSLGLPAKVGYPKGISGIVDKVDSPSFAASIGLFSYLENDSYKKSGRGYEKFLSIGGVDIKSMGKKLRNWTDKFLP